MAEQRENGAYTKGEMVRIAIEEQVQPDPVPETWIGTALLPDGAKKATKAQIAKADNGDEDGADSTPAPDPDAPPAGNASRADWAAYALAHGAKEEDLVADGKELTRDEIRDKYTPAGS